MKKAMILLLFFLPVFLFAGEAEDTFTKANQAYKQGDFDQAINLYEQLLDNGYKDAEIFYNLGNAFYRKNEIANSILNYERALRLDPDNEDIRFNLQVTNLKTVDKIEGVPEFFLTSWINSIHTYLGSGGWAGVAVVAAWLVLGLFAGFLFINKTVLKKAFFAGSVFFAAIFIFTVYLAWQSYNYETSENKAIIFSTNVYVKSSPDSGSQDLFILHEGTKVELLDQVEDWREIKLSDGNVGWIPGNSLVVI